MFPFNNPLFPCLNKLPCDWYMPAKNLEPYAPLRFTYESLTGTFFSHASRGAGPRNWLT